MSPKPSLAQRARNVLAPSRAERTSLPEQDAENVFRSARFIVGSVEGQRFVPGDEPQDDDLVAELDRLIFGK